jgi:hypothetical protein
MSFPMGLDEATIQYAIPEWQKIPTPIMDAVGIPASKNLRPGGGNLKLTDQEKERLLAGRFDIIDAFKAKGIDLSQYWLGFQSRANSIFAELVDVEKALSVGIRVNITDRPGAGGHTYFPGGSNAYFLEFAKSKKGVAKRAEELKGLFGGRGKKSRKGKSKKARKTRRRRA